MASAKTRKKEKQELAELKTLGKQLLSSRAHINNLPRILSHVSPSTPPQFALEAILTLHTFFAVELAELPTSTATKEKFSKEKVEPEIVYATVVRAKFEEFVNALVEVALSSEADETLKEVVLETIMEFVKNGNAGGFHSSVYNKLLLRIVVSDKEDFVLELLSSKYFQYIDVRYFTYISVREIVKSLEVKGSAGEGDESRDDDNRSESERIELSIRKIHYILSHIPVSEDSDKSSESAMWSSSGMVGSEGDETKSKKRSNVLSAEKVLKKMKVKFTKAWTSFLRLPIPLDVYKEVLVNLHQVVIPHLSKPTILCDFLTRSYDIGGVISVMALSSLFILMTQHALEYPNFYEKLYALLVPSVFIAKHRAKFFELLDMCLKSPLLPAYLTASFAKKLSRLALYVPPSGALVVIALVHNLLRRHPAINCLVHREDDEKSHSDDKSAERLGVDPFNNETLDLSKTMAMRSSLWEIDTLHRHYCPPVSRFVLSLKADLTVKAKTTEIAVKDFSAASYASIFGEEMRKRVNKVPTAILKTKPVLFTESDFPGFTFNVQENVEKGSAKRQRIVSS